MVVGCACHGLRLCPLWLRQHDRAHYGSLSGLSHHSLGRGCAAYVSGPAARLFLQSQRRDHTLWNGLSAGLFRGWLRQPGYLVEIRLPDLARQSRLLVGHRTPMVETRWSMVKTLPAVHRIALACAIVFVLLARTASAQVSGGTISGTITDPTGAVLADAEVLIENTATGEARKLNTTSNGFYSAPNLTPGTYRLPVSAPGFATLVTSDVPVA